MFKKLVKNVYHNLFDHRCEMVSYLKYYTYQDFKGMKEESIAFLNKDGETLRGGLYYNQESLASYNEVVIFCHGMWSGYLNYMNEIAMLVERGFLVFTYNITATHSSEGTRTKGFCKPLEDLKEAYNYIKSRSDLKTKKIFIVGHSWGGFTSLNSANLFSDILKIVAISPPLSLNAIMKTSFGPLYPLVKKEVFAIEKEYFGDLIYVDGIDALKTKSDFLIIYSKDDNMVKDKYNYLPIRKMGNITNLKTIVFNDRGHHPHYTKEANMQYADLNNRLRQYSKEKKSVDEIKMLLNDVNWEKVVEQDQEVWEQIALFLREN